MYRVVLLSILLVFTGCSTSQDHELQMFVSGDIENSIAINLAANNQAGVDCGISLRPVGMRSPDPSNDGLLTLWARSLALQSAIQGPCGQILAPFLLKIIGKTPFGFFSPF